MAYIGAQPNKQLTKPTRQSFNGTGSATAFTLNRAVNTGEELEVFVDNVQQEPGSGKSYTAIGTTLTFDEAPPLGTGNVYVIYRGQAEVTTRLEPQDLSITTAKLAASAVTTAKITDANVTDAKIDTMAASKLTGALPAIDGSSLTGLTSGFTFASAQTLNGESSRTFTGIPSGTNIIKYGVWRHSGSAQATFQLMLGDSGGIETSGYSRGDQYANTGGGTMQGSSSASDSAWTLGSWTGSSNVIMHQGEIFRVDGNKWLLNANAIYVQGPNYFLHYHGYKELSGELTQIKFQLSTGTFDDSAGVVRIGYQ